MNGDRDHECVHGVGEATRVRVQTGVVSRECVVRRLRGPCGGVVCMCCFGLVAKQGTGRAR